MFFPNKHLFISIPLQSLIGALLVILFQVLCMLFPNLEEIISVNWFEEFLAIFLVLSTIQISYFLITPSYLKNIQRNTLKNRKKSIHKQCMLDLASNLNLEVKQDHLEGVYKQYCIQIYYDKVYDGHSKFISALNVDFNFQYPSNNFEETKNWIHRLSKKYANDELINFTPFVLSFGLRYKKQNLNYDTILSHLHKGVQLLRINNLSFVNSENHEELILNYTLHEVMNENTKNE